MARPRVLISAYACEPGRGSEPEVGWCWVAAAARVAEVTVLLREQHLPGIREHEATHGPLGVQWQPLRGPWCLPLGHGRGAMLQVHYLGWQRLALEVARGLHAEQAFDLVHHVTFVTFTYPSFLWRLGPPFIFGPVAGADRAPASLRSTMSARWRLVEYGKLLRDRVLGRLPSVARCLRAADRVLAVNPQNVAHLRRVYGVKAELRSALCYARDAAPTPPAPPVANGLRVVYAGAMMGWKGLELAMRAFRLYRRQEDPAAQFEIIGDGRDAPAFRRRAVELGIDEATCFRGQLPRGELIARLAASDVLLFPSLRDSGGFVVVEALAQGCPVITRAASGPGMHVRHGYDGLLTTAERPAALVRQAAAHLARIRRQPFDRAAIRRAAARFDPVHLQDDLRRLYDEVLHG